MPPPEKWRSPRITTPGAANTEVTAKATTSALTVTRRGRRGAVTCRVSLLLPDTRRRWWHYVARCPVCGRPHLGRARELAAVTGERRLPCGHWIAVVVARTYGRGEAA